METIGILLIIVVIFILLLQYGTMAFKIGYYEETFRLHEDLFDEETFKHIEDVMNKKHPF